MSDILELYIIVCYLIHAGAMIGASADSSVFGDKKMLIGMIISQVLAPITVPIVIGTNFK